MTEDKPKFSNKRRKHEICSDKELNFLAGWLRVAFELEPNLRAKVNSVSIALTGEFIGIDQAGVIQVCKVEGWQE